MSRYVYAECFKAACCDGGEGRSPDLNRGEDVFRELWAARHELAAAVDLLDSVDVYATGDRAGLVRWVIRHRDHAVELRDEYGGVYPLWPERAPVAPEESC